MKLEKYHPDQLLVYFSNPYTSDIPMLVARRFEEIRQITAEVLLSVPTIVPLSPIAYTHQFGHLNVDFLTRIDYRLIDACDACLVVMQKGWLESEGVQAERAYCQRHEVPLYHTKPETVIETCKSLWNQRLIIKELNHRRHS